jgi:hypothetical protein
MLVDGVKCFSCHKTKGPILGGARGHDDPQLAAADSGLRLLGGEAAKPEPGPGLGGRFPPGFDLGPDRGRFGDIDVLSAQAFKVDEHVRLGAERLRNREAFRLSARYPGGSKLLASMLGGLVTPVAGGRPGEVRPPLGGLGIPTAVPLAKVDQDMKGKIDAALRSSGYGTRWLEHQKASPSSILLDFSPAGPKPPRSTVEWGGTPAAVRKYDESRATVPVVLPSNSQPSSPKAFQKHEQHPGASLDDRQRDAVGGNHRCQRGRSRLPRQHAADRCSRSTTPR